MHRSHTQLFGHRCCSTRIHIPGTAAALSPVTMRIPLPNWIRGWDTSSPVLGGRSGQTRRTVPFSPFPHSTPGPSTPAAELSPAPRHIPQPPPRDGPCLPLSPTPCPQRLASRQVSLGRGPLAPRVAHLAEDPTALYRRPGLGLRILLRARRVPALVIRHGGATDKQETGPRSLSCAGGGAQSPG